MDPKTLEAVEVRRDVERVGTLRRTQQGSVFEYDDAFLQSLRERPGRGSGIAIHLPHGSRRFETVGVNLHPFFAGLLPEGLRLRAVVNRVKTSEDDLLSLLIATGEDCIGDVSISARANAVEETTRSREAPALERVLFSELLQESLAQAGEPGVEPTIPGVQEKVSGSVISFPVQLAKRREAHILKLNPPDKPHLIENEAFFMNMARGCGLETSDVTLVRDREGNPGLLVTRFDRVWSKSEKRFVRLHQEDACQFLNRYPAEKYRLTCRDIAEGLSICAAPIPERARFIRLVAFSYLIANGDLHARNVSVGEAGVGGLLRLTPAYDLLSTLPYGDRRMALRLDGRDDNLKGRYFVEFGERLGVKAVAVKKSLHELYERSEPWLTQLEKIGFDDRRTADLERVMRKRREEVVDFG